MVNGYDGGMQLILKPCASAPSVLAPGSAAAVRLRSSLLLAGASPGPVQSPEEAAEKQAAYERSRAKRRKMIRQAEERGLKLWSG
jgi:hypothetical protein